MCKRSWGPCFNSGHETLAGDLLIQIQNRKAVEAKLLQCQEGSECEAKLSDVLRHVVILNDQAETQAQQIEILRASGSVVEPPPPTYQQDISGAEVHRLIRDAVGSRAKIFLADGTYKLPLISEVELFIWHVAVYKMVWLFDEQDCDDFTLKLRAELIRPLWRWTPRQDVWFTHPDIGPHSEMLLTALNDKVEGTPQPAEFLIEAQYTPDMEAPRVGVWELAEEMFDALDDGDKPYYVGG